MSKRDRIYPLEVAGVMLRRPSLKALEQKLARIAVAKYAAKVRLERDAALARRRVSQQIRFNTIRDKRLAEAV